MKIRHSYLSLLRLRCLTNRHSPRFLGFVFRTTRAMFSGVSGMGSGSSSGGRPTGRLGRGFISSFASSLGPDGFRFEVMRHLTAHIITHNTQRKKARIQSEPVGVLVYSTPLHPAIPPNSKPNPPVWRRIPDSVQKNVCGVAQVKQVLDEMWMLRQEQPQLSIQSTHERFHISISLI